MCVCTDNCGLTFPDIVCFRNVLGSEGVVAIHPAEGLRGAVLRTRYCNIHQGLEHKPVSHSVPEYCFVFALSFI